MSVSIFCDLNAGTPTHRKGTLRSAIALASAWARAAYSLFQFSVSGVSRTSFTRIC